MVNTASDVKLNALSNALSFDPFAPLLSSEIALKVCPDFYCSPIIWRKIPQMTILALHKVGK